MRPYRIDVRQGNFVSQEMVAQLKPGQTREQVRFILGSPLIEDPFHAQRWDYVYRFAKGNGDVSERKLTIFFEDNKLSRMTGDVVAPQNSGNQQAPATTTRVLEIGDPAKKKGT